MWKNRKIDLRISENVNLLIVSFALAFLTWVLAKSGTTEETRLVVPVRVLNNDPRVELRVEPESVPVMIRYSRDSAAYINSDNFRFQIDTLNLRNNLDVNWKVISQPLGEQNWVANVPVRVDLVKIGTQSNSVDVHARYKATQVSVVANVSDMERLPEGFQLNTPVQVQPRTVWVTGSEDVLHTLAQDPVTSRQAIYTERVSVAGRTQSALESLRLELPPELELVPGQAERAEVNLEIQEVQTLHEITNVPLRFKAVSAGALTLQYNATSATVSVYGPRSLIRTLGPDSVKMRLVQPPEEIPGMTRDLPLEATFAPAVADEVRNRVSIRSIEPATIRVTYLDNTTTATTRPATAD